MSKIINGMETTVQRFETKGISLHYVMQGSGDPVLLIPGLISDYRTWSYQMDALSRHFTVIAMSRRYQYPSSYVPGGESGIQTNTEDIKALLEHLGIKNANVIGHSYGGYIAVNLAIQYPQLVSKLVLEEPIMTPLLVRNPYNLFHWISLMIRDKNAAAAFAKMGFKGFNGAVKAINKNDLDKAKKVFIDTLFRKTSTPDDLDELSKIQLEVDIPSMPGEDPTKHKLSLDDLTQIHIDTLILNGDRSSYVFSYICHELSKLLIKCKHVQVSNSSHWVHIDQKEEYNKHILEFLMT